MLQVKVACGVAAIGANLVCLVLVVQRYRRRHDEAAERSLTRKIRFTLAGIVPGLVAVFLGFAYFHR
jgi:hypothetical protein